MPHSLKRPSPIERDTSTIPITLPSLRGERGGGGEGEREKERGRERQREKERGRERQREKERGRRRQREKERGRQRQRETEGGRQRQWEKEGENRDRGRREGEEKVTSWMLYDIPPTHMKCTYSTSLYLQLSQSFSFHQTTLDRDL